LGYFIDAGGRAAAARFETSPIQELELPGKECFTPDSKFFNENRVWMHIWDEEWSSVDYVKWFVKMNLTFPPRKKAVLVVHSIRRPNGVVTLSFEHKMKKPVPLELFFSFLQNEAARTEGRKYIFHLNLHSEDWREAQTITASWNDSNGWRIASMGDLQFVGRAGDFIVVCKD